VNQALAVFGTCALFVFGQARAEDSFALLRSGSRVAITDVTSAGITLAPDRGRPAKVESLAQVKIVTGPLATKFEENRSLATDLWRASARLNREDEGGAEPLYEKLWQLTTGVSGPTRAEIASGLATCRVHRGALATAIAPWVEWIRQSSSLSSDQLATQRAQLGISDPTAFWIDTLPPIWTDSTAVRALASQSVELPSGSGTHPSADDLALIYTIAARRDAGQPWKIDQGKALKDSAWANLAGEMVLAESEIAEVRTESRQRLTSRLGADVPLWKQVWIRLALGRSLILESEFDDRRAGVLNLLWIASRPAAPSQLLALALVSASKGLVLLSDFDGARSLLADLERRFAGDPILDSPGIASARRAVSQASPPLPVPTNDKD
jgi:hypothetical protein